MGSLRAVMVVGCCLFAACVSAHPPYGHTQHHQWLLDADPDIAGAIQEHLPLSYRERKNRPRFIGGMMAYLVSPNSQEAMSWHEHVHRGTYANPHAPAVCKKYYYPKPWEIIPIGPRDCGKKPGSGAGTEVGVDSPTEAATPIDAETVEPQPLTDR